jgi:tRNA (mo5U34)-methyltransferase
MPSPDELRAEAGTFAWFHSIDLGGGVVTKGLSELSWPVEQLPDFAGRSVLDIGAWDGYYSFLAERQGAARVVALDHYAWGVDFIARGAYWTECFASGTLPDHTRDTTDFWREDLPGRRGFDLAREVLGSKVEAVVADFTTTDLDALGTFDVVLYLGVLYHMKEPLTCLERLRAVTREVAVIETEAVHLHGLDHDSLLQFHAGGDVQTDFGNWYVPTIQALRSLCRAAGFSRVETIAGPPAPPEPDPVARRGLGQLLRSSDERPDAPPPSAPTTAYRALVHAYV